MIVDWDFSRDPLERRKAVPFGVEKLQELADIAELREHRTAFPPGLPPEAIIVPVEEMVDAIVNSMGDPSANAVTLPQTRLDWVILIAASVADVPPSEVMLLQAIDDRSNRIPISH